MVAFAAGNLGSALAASYPVLMAARFVSGLPHGAFFGIGAVVAASLVPRHRRTWAVSMMLTGLTVANVVGVPLTTLIGQHLGWQWPYALVGIVAVGTVVALWCWVPSQPADSDRLDGLRARLAAPGAGVAGPADRHRRLRRHVRDLLLHRPDDDRARRLLRGHGAGDPRRLRLRHDRRGVPVRPGRRRTG